MVLRACALCGAWVHAAELRWCCARVCVCGAVVCSAVRQSVGAAEPLCSAAQYESALVCDAQACA